MLTHGNPQLEGGWLYAVGDVNHRVLLTHQGKYQAPRRRRRHRRPREGTGPGRRTRGACTPRRPTTGPCRRWCSPSPRSRSVGLTADAAEKAGLRVKVLDYDLGAVSGAGLHADGYTGQVRAIVDLDRESIVGMTLLGPDVAEMLHAATIAIVGEVPIARLWHAVPAFPTMSEVWLRLLEAYGRPTAED